MTEWLVCVDKGQIAAEGQFQKMSLSQKKVYLGKQSILRRYL